MSSGNVRAVNGHFEKFQRWRQDLLSQRVAVVLHTIAGDDLEHDGDIDEFIRGFGLTSDIQFDPQSFPTYAAQNSRAIEGEIAILSRTLQQVASFEGESSRLRSARALYQEGVEIDSILKQLGYVHRDTLKQACDMLVGIGVPLENIVEFLRPKQSDHSPIASSGDAYTGYAGNLLYRMGLWLKDSWEDPRNLSESTKDIACVMLTQLPAIPALKISFTELLKQFANVKDDEPISREQLSKILTVMPALGYGVAALADNVPGYLILEGVILRLFQQTFSAEALAQVPHLNTRIGFISKIIASQSGMVFPFSSATNLLQDNIEILPTDDPEFALGFGVKRTKVNAKTTLQNFFMLLSAGATITGAGSAISNIVDEASAAEDRLKS
jgi:hypothetical protein